MSTPRTTADLPTTSSNLKSLNNGHLEDTGGLLRLSPTWVPRSFLQPGLRIKLHPDDTYAYGLSRRGKTMWDKYAKWPVYSMYGPEVNPDASAIVAYKN
jgi:hypothetical protein